MGFLKGLKGVVGALFSTPAAVAAIIEAATGKANTKGMSAEAKAAYNQQVIDSAGRLLEASEGSNVSRRLIVQVVFFIWAVGTLIMFAAIGLEASFAPAFAQYMGDNVTPLMFVLIAFYFGKQVISSAIDAVGRKAEKVERLKGAAHTVRDLGRKVRGK